MNRVILRDAVGKIIGYIDTEATGEQLAKNAAGKYLGKYDPRTNLTYDKFGKILYTGNMVQVLIR